MTIRPDYPVLGNLLVIKVAEMLTTLIGGHPLAAVGPNLQHLVASGYVALIFLGIFTNLRRHQGAAWSLGITLFMLAMPDLDNENRIFGEANNVGYFSALAVLFVYYDFWLSETVSPRRLLCWLAWVVFHILTSPMAGLVCAGLGGLLLARAAWDQWRKHPVPRLSALSWIAHAACMALSAYIVIHAKVHNTQTQEGFESAITSEGPSVGWRLVEMVIGRELLYPLTAAFHTESSDAITLSLLAGWLLFVAAVILWGFRAGREAAARRRMLGWLWLLIVGLGMALVTLISRKFLLLSGKPYQSLWPARYHLAQTMIFAGFFALGLQQLATRFPSFRSSSVWILSLLIAVCGWQQRDRILDCVRQDSPRIAARTWDAQFQRTLAVQALTGDAAAAVQSSRPDLLYTAEMYLDRHQVRVPVRMVDADYRKKVPPTKTACALSLVPANSLQLRANATKPDFQIKNVQLIPRQSGCLVAIDATLLNIGIFAEHRRKLWLAGAPGQPTTAAFAHRMENLTAPRRDDKERSNWYFQIYLFYADPAQTVSLLETLPSLLLGMGDAADNCHAVASAPAEPLSFTSLNGDENLDLLLHPIDACFRWKAGGPILATRNLVVSGETLTLNETGPFEEAAYLLYNPDVAAAVQRQLVPSGQAHFEAFGKREGRASFHRSFTLDLTAAHLTAAELQGLEIKLTPSRFGFPVQRLHCLLHTPSGPTQSFRLSLTEGTASYRAFHLDHVLTPSPEPFQSLEIELEAPLQRPLRITEVELFKRSAP